MEPDDLEKLAAQHKALRDALTSVIKDKNTLDVRC